MYYKRLSCPLLCKCGGARPASSQSQKPQRVTCPLHLMYVPDWKPTVFVEMRLFYCSCILVFSKSFLNMAQADVAFRKPGLRGNAECFYSLACFIHIKTVCMTVRFHLSGITTALQIEECVSKAASMCFWPPVCNLCACAAKLICVSETFLHLRACVFVWHLERTVKVSLWSLDPVSCQMVRDAAPLKGMLSRPFLSIISPGTLINAVSVHSHVPQAAAERSHLSN